MAAEHNAHRWMKLSECDRFWMKADVKEDKDACWPWMGSTQKSRSGLLYGNFHRDGGKLVRAHRYVFGLLFGPVEADLDIHHTCENSLCVNPHHLEKRTRKSHVAVSRNHSANKTHCPSGHPYDEENTRWYQGRRYCRACTKIRLAKYTVKRREASAERRRQLL